MRSFLRLCGFAATCALALASAARPVSAAPPVPRHALESAALIDPEGVLRELPRRVLAARAAGDWREVAMLHLAESNACRVVADWPCQRDAGEQALDAARATGEPLLVVRALVATARGRVALQDFSDAEHLLGEAELQLRATPHPDLLADVWLAYSSLSSSLGRDKASADFASRGLASLSPASEPSLRVRLLRNRARSETLLGETDAAQRTLAEAQAAIAALDDPKLHAELFLEAARTARRDGDVAAQRTSALRVLEFAERLANTQLEGQGHEALGHAALAEGDREQATREFRASYTSFSGLGLDRDAARVLRALLVLRLDAGAAAEELRPLVRAFLDIEEGIDQSDRAKAAADFDARLRYAAQELALVEARGSAEVAAVRAQAFESELRFNRVVVLCGAGLLLVLAALFAQRVRANRELRRALAREQESESRYRTLAENSRDLVVRMNAQGRRLYISPSAQELLGWSPAELMDPRWDLVHPDDVKPTEDAIRTLLRDGGTLSMRYRVRHRDGHYVWIEVSARRIENAGAFEILYTGRDVTVRVEAERALAASQERLRALADNVPALISHIDADERYLFSNAFTGRVLGVDPATLVGRTVREVRGEDTYRELQPYIRRVLAGERVNFEGETELRGKRYAYQGNYVPDVGPDGRVTGFFSLILDITAMKAAERQLAQLARHDSLTAVANRRQFDERLEQAVARSRRGHPLALLYLDLDRFKAVNDELGHGAGDDVLVEFAKRLSGSVRETDLVARLGGDEFVVLIEDAASPDVAETVARKLCDRMRTPVPTRAGAIDASTSVGIAWLREANTPAETLALADRALYAAKSAGRNTWRTLTDDGDAASRVAAGA